MQATILADDRPDGPVALVDQAGLAVKAAIAEQLGMNALRRLTGASAVRARPLDHRMRRHAVEADAAIKRAKATLPSGMGAAPVAMSAVREGSASAAALWDLHGGQLRGFALLLTLGDQPAAAKLAADALAAGAIRAHELKHPRRAAAWLRHSVLRDGKRRRTEPNQDKPTRRAALRALGVNDQAHAALSALSTLERAAVLASGVEGLEEPDVAAVVGLDPVRSRRLVRDALRRAISAAMGEPSESGSDGPIVARTREIAARVLA
jgi:DNA-directed RNA polymerase specialized sigma24 family protein